MFARIGLLLGSVMAFVITGGLWWTAGTVTGGLDFSDALGDGPRSSGGAQNILLMGLDTRRDKHGDDLPADVLRQLHAGDGEVGGYNTNTLIVLHVPAAGTPITAFSIPRDDLVTVHGLGCRAGQDQRGVRPHQGPRRGHPAGRWRHRPGDARDPGA